MTTAIFALVGTLLGILGTLAVEMVRARIEDTHSRRDALRLTCADFTAAVAQIRTLAFEARHKSGDIELLSLMDNAHREARVHYERLRLTAASREVQMAGRYVLRYAYGLLRQANGRSLREDEREHGPFRMLYDSLIALYAAVRQETGVPQANDVYREPDDWVDPSEPTARDTPSPS
jgi:hypothetical protein